MRRAFLGIQTAYFAVTGLWPLVHMPSFERVTGPKRDRWLVRVIGALATADAIVLAIGTARAEPSLEVRALAVTSAAAFAITDVIYAAPGKISRVYLADALAEAIFIAAQLTP